MQLASKSAALTAPPSPLPPSWEPSEATDSNRSLQSCFSPVGGVKHAWLGVIMADNGHFPGSITAESAGFTCQITPKQNVAQFFRIVSNDAVRTMWESLAKQKL